MKIRGLTLLLCFLSTLTFSQANDISEKAIVENLPHYYFDCEGNVISKNTYKSLMDPVDAFAYCLPMTIKNDTAIISTWTYREYFEKLDAGSLEIVQKYLQELVSYPLDFTKDVAIAYFKKFKNKDCAEFYLNTPRFNKYKNASQYIAFIKKGQDVGKVAYPYYVDELGLMEDELFFKLDMACSHWMVLKPDGNYRLYFGEGGPIMFMDEMDEKWDKKFIKNRLNREID